MMDNEQLFRVWNVVLFQLCIICSIIHLDIAKMINCVIFCIDLHPIRKSRQKSPNLRATRRKWPLIPLLLLQSKVLKSRHQPNYLFWSHCSLGHHFIIWMISLQWPDAAFRGPSWRQWPGVWLDWKWTQVGVKIQLQVHKRHKTEVVGERCRSRAEREKTQQIPVGAAESPRSTGGECQILKKVLWVDRNVWQLSY